MDRGTDTASGRRRGEEEAREVVAEDLERREERAWTRAASWERTVEKERGAAKGAGEQGLLGWWRVKWTAEPSK